MYYCSITKTKKEMVQGRTVGLVAGLGAAAFLGYCIYFDQMRRSAPDFKAKLKERRKRTARDGGGSGKGAALPDFSDHESVQRFFLQEVQLGEELLGQGDIESGVEHLSLAVAVCGQPHSLLGVLQQTLPQPVYTLLLQNLDKAQRRVRSHAASSIQGLEASSEGSGKPGLSEEDVE
jgi:import receptor subunit TOM20